MSKIKGGIAMAGFVCPSDSTDTYPTHLAKYGKGGYRSVQTTAERDAIPEARRSIGMQVYVIDEKEVYILGADGSWNQPVGGAGSYRIFPTKSQMDSFASSGQIENGVIAYAKDTMLTYRCLNNQWEQLHTLGSGKTLVSEIDGGTVRYDEFRQLSGIATSYTIQEQIDKAMSYKGKDGVFPKFQIYDGQIVDTWTQLNGNDVEKVYAECIDGQLMASQMPTYGLDRAAFTHGEFPSSVIPAHRDRRERIGSNKAPFSNVVLTLDSGQVSGVEDNARRSYFIYCVNTRGQLRYSIDTNGASHWSSDERLKENIEKIEGVLDKYEKMRGVMFNYTDSPDEPMYGVIAQEVLGLFPELVKFDDEGENEKVDNSEYADEDGNTPNGYMSVNYGGFHGINIQAMKELKALVDAQDARMDEQDAEIAELIKKMEEK